MHEFLISLLSTANNHYSSNSWFDICATRFCNCPVDDHQNLITIGDLSDNTYFVRQDLTTSFYYKSTPDYTSPTTQKYDCGYAVFSPQDSLLHSSFIGGSSNAGGEDGLAAISYWGRYLYIDGAAKSGQNNTVTWPLVNLGGNPAAWWQPLITNVNSGNQDAMVTRFNLYNPDIPVGVKGILRDVKNSEIFMYPNPTNDKLFVEFKAVKPNSQLLVYNLVGELLQTQPFIEYKTEVNVVRLPAGLYIIKVVDGTSTYTGKFIKE